MSETTDEYPDITTEESEGIEDTRTLREQVESGDLKVQGTHGNSNLTPEEATALLTELHADETWVDQSWADPEDPKEFNPIQVLYIGILWGQAHERSPYLDALLYLAGQVVVARELIEEQGFTIESLTPVMSHMHLYFKVVEHGVEIRAIGGDGSVLLLSYSAGEASDA